MDKRTPIINVKKLNVTYFPGRSNEVHALKDISLDIYPGEYIIFFGPSGCGKSTLLYSLAGLERNVTGVINVKNRNLAELRQRELEDYYQTTIGMIFQSYFLIPSLKVAENVALPQVAVAAPRGPRMKRAVELLTKFGVGAQAWKLPQELSGGQQQRVAICRALINEPSILVADEPVGNLDSKSTKDVMDLLRYLNDVQKKTVILVTHDPSHLFHANRIFYLRDGEITGSKTNTEEERKQPTVAPGTGAALTMASALTHWVRTFAPPKGKAAAATSTLIAGKQTQEIMAEALTGFSGDELVALEEKLFSLIKTGKQEGQSIYAFLTKGVSTGGVGMRKPKALRLSKEMQALARMVRHLETEAAKSAKKQENKKKAERAAIREMRLDLAVRCSLTLTPKTANILERIIDNRLKGAIDRRQVQKQMHFPAAHGGAGISLWKARKASRLLEAFMPSAVGTAGTAQIPTSAEAMKAAALPPPPTADE